jgi:hypothetical protein
MQVAIKCDPRQAQISDKTRGAYFVRRRSAGAGLLECGAFFEYIRYIIMHGRSLRLHK